MRGRRSESELEGQEIGGRERTNNDAMRCDEREASPQCLKALVFLAFAEAFQKVSAGRCQASRTLRLYQS